MFVSLVVFSLLFASRVVSYEWEDFEEDEEDFATVCGKVK